jgi:hypothetical protein
MKQFNQAVLLLALVLASHGCAREIYRSPATVYDARNYFNSGRLQLVSGSTTAHEVREVMEAPPSGQLADGRVWFYFWNVQPRWRGVPINPHEDLTDKYDRIYFTEYLFLKFDDAGVLRRHLLTNNRYKRDAFDNAIVASIASDEKR